MREDELITATDYSVMDRVGRRFVGTEAERQALIEVEGNKLLTRYQDCEDGFLRLLEVTNATTSQGRELQSPVISIGKAVERVDVYDYRGTWTVRVINTPDKQAAEYPSLHPEFTIRARFIADDPTLKDRVRSEFLPRREEHFGHAFAFSQANQEGWNKETLAYVVENYSESITRAEETLVMLWAAIGNKELNPELEYSPWEGFDNSIPE